MKLCPFFSTHLFAVSPVPVQVAQDQGQTTGACQGMRLARGGEADGSARRSLRSGGSPSTLAAPESRERRLVAKARTAAKASRADHRRRRRKLNLPSPLSRVARYVGAIAKPWSLASPTGASGLTARKTDFAEALANQKQSVSRRKAATSQPPHMTRGPPEEGKRENMSIETGEQASVASKQTPPHAWVDKPYRQHHGHVGSPTCGRQ